MSNKERSTRSNLAIVPPMDAPERFQQNANAGRSFVTVARRDPSAPAAREGDTSAPQLLPVAMQALDDINSRP